jgi:phospholipase C
MQKIAIESAQFSNVFLRMDGAGVTTFTGPGGGTVNCQYGHESYEAFLLEWQSEDTLAIASVEFPGVYLRMDGNGVTVPTTQGGGTVNCQWGHHSWEAFRLEWQDDSTIAIASVQFPGVYLRMDGNGVTTFTGPGGGKVNCQYGVGAWERFRFIGVKL